MMKPALKHHFGSHLGDRRQPKMIRWPPKVTPARDEEGLNPEGKMGSPGNKLSWNSKAVLTKMAQKGILRSL